MPCKLLEQFSQIEEKKGYNHQAVLLDKGRPKNGSSTKSIIHFAQNFRWNDFREIDYGLTDNMKKYGTAIPPLIMMSDIKKVPVAMFVGKDDNLASPGVGQWARDFVSTTVSY